MGAQQILLVLLSVIIVGIAISVGIVAMNYQAQQQNRSNIIADMHYIASEAAAYYRTPVSFGGGEGAWDQDALYEWIAIPKNKNGKRFITPNGEIRLVVNRQGQRLTLTAWGNEIGYDEDKAIRARLIFKGPDAEPVLKLIN